MTYQTKYRENKRLLEGYANFMNECTVMEDKLKLSAEIARLVSQNKQIDAMPYGFTKMDISDYTIEVKAILRDPNPIDPHAKIPQLMAAIPGANKEHLIQALAAERKNKKRTTAVHLLQSAIRNFDR